MKTGSNGANRRLRLGYNTSAFARTHNMTDIIQQLHNIGYAGVELTLDRRHFHPHFADPDDRRDLKRALVDCRQDIVINVGGRFVLSPVAHEPSLVSATAAERKRFCDFAAEAISLAAEVSARVVMLHSGALPPGVAAGQAWSWLIAEAAQLAQLAARCGVVIGFEFHPAMLVANLDDYRRLKSEVGHDALRLTLDVGHVVCTDTRPVSEVISECAADIVNVHLEDIKGRQHVHLPIGDGDVDFADVFDGLERVGYDGLINAEFNTTDLEVDEWRLAQQTYEKLRRLV
ncbi:MAG: sugar phosphate isomerase/epimerase [Anaerolineales bacterium]|nr:sugar phosphate isomerase/epimerase [Anaerolineales bacterium]